MILFRKDDDYEPVAWVRGMPIHVTTLLVFLHVLMLIGLSLARMTEHPAFRSALIFDSVKVLGHGELWRLASYPLVQVPFNPLFFALEMFFLYLFGREVERYIGRRRFVGLYLLLVLVPTLLLTPFGALYPMALAGSHEIHFAIFVTFAVLYPGVEFFLRIPARWLAWGFLGIFSFYYLSVGDLPRFCAIVADSLTAWLFVQWMRGSLHTWFASFSRPWEPEPAPQRPPRRPSMEHRPVEKDPVAAIDPLLDKIAEHGLKSLTPQEVARLEEARTALLERSREGKSLSANGS